MTSLDDLPELAPYLPDMEDMEDDLRGAGRRPPAPTRRGRGAGSRGADGQPHPPADEAADEPGPAAGP